MNVRFRKLISRRKTHTVDDSVESGAIDPWKPKTGTSLTFPSGGNSLQKS